jgi:hypothetical protein
MNPTLATTGLALCVQTALASPVIADPGRPDTRADTGAPGRITGGQLVATGDVEAAYAPTGLEARYVRHAIAAPPWAAIQSPTRRSSSVSNRN